MDADRDELVLLRECQQMLQALQWAGSIDSMCPTCGPRPVCAVCLEDEGGAHEADCKLRLLLEKLGAYLG